MPTKVPQALPARPSGEGRDEKWRRSTSKQFSPYLKENQTLHHYEDELIFVVQENNRCLE
jgi:hypothetical protein